MTDQQKAAGEEEKGTEILVLLKVSRKEYSDSTILTAAQCLEEGHAVGPFELVQTSNIVHLCQ